MNQKLPRRKFVATALGLAATSPLLSIRSAFADNHQVKLEEDNLQAVSLGYKHDAEDVDTTRFPRRAGDGGKTQFCNNCQLYLGAVDKEWAPCAIFGNNLVKGAGWCNAWVKKVG